MCPNWGSQVAAARGAGLRDVRAVRRVRELGDGQWRLQHRVQARRAQLAARAATRWARRPQWRSQWLEWRCGRPRHAECIPDLGFDFDCFPRRIMRGAVWRAVRPEVRALRDPEVLTGSSVRRSSMPWPVGVLSFCRLVVGLRAIRPPEAQGRGEHSCAGKVQVKAACAATWTLFGTFSHAFPSCTPSLTHTLCHTLS